MFTGLVNKVADCKLSYSTNQYWISI